MDGWVNGVPTESKMRESTESRMREYCPQTAGNSLSETQKFKKFQKNSNISGGSIP